MKKLTYIAAFALAGLSSAFLGCSVETTEETTEIAQGSEGDSPEVGSEILTTVDVGYGTIRFHEHTDEDGNVTIYMSEDAPSDYAGTPFDETLMGHTTLEIFMAVSPGEDIPQSIQDAHAAEAETLGRDNDDIIAANFDQDAPVEKMSSSWCSEYIWAESYTCPQYLQSYKEYETNTGDNSLYIKDDDDYMTTSSVTLGICNASSSSIDARLSWDTDGDTDHSWQDLTSGTKSALSSNYGRRYVGINYSATGWGGNTPSRYRIKGYASSSQTYYLRTAKTYNYMASGCVY